MVKFANLAAVMLGLVPLLSGLNLRPLEGHLDLVSGFVWWRIEKPIGASPVHEVCAYQPGEGEWAWHGLLVSLRQSQEQVRDQGDSDLDAHGIF
ncbi:hypothetical protein AGR7B_Lc30106 [Agrobacterium deltaense RV3]|nr:hypothetical protein AGR7B_Lc30106 [Agrobacterium deltaense RV3]